MQTKMIQTKHGTISLTESSGQGENVLLLHEICTSKDVFHKQFDSDLAERFHLLALDLPGHGASQDALNPEKTYSMSGYARAVVAALQELKIDKVTILGWGLGGYIGLEMIGQGAWVDRLLISGTSPMGKSAADLSAAYHHSDEISLAGLELLSDEQAWLLGRAILASRHVLPDYLLEAIKRTDGLARRLVFENIFSDEAVDYKHVAEVSQIPLAVVNGTEDHFINNDFFGTVPYKNLWEETLFLLPHCGHAAFLESPTAFNRILLRFLSDN